MGARRRVCFKYSPLRDWKARELEGHAASWRVTSLVAPVRPPCGWAWDAGRGLNGRRNAVSPFCYSCENGPPRERNKNEQKRVKKVKCATQGGRERKARAVVGGNRECPGGIFKNRSRHFPEDWMQKREDLWLLPYCIITSYVSLSTEWKF